MSRRWWVLVAALLVLLGVPLALGYGVLHTQGGLEFVLRQLDRLETLRVEVTGVRGTLAGPLAVDSLLIEHETVRLEARDLELEVRTAALIHGQVRLERLEVGHVEVVLRPHEQRPAGDPHFLPHYLEVSAPVVRLGDVALTLVNGRQIRVESVHGALQMTRWRMDLADVVVVDPAGRVDAALTLRATQPLGLRVTANGRWTLPDEHTYRFAVATRGRLDRLATTVTLAEPANLSFIGNALTLTENPRVVGTLRATDFDGSPWVPAGRLPAVSGSVAIDGRAEAIGIDGTLTSAPLADQPLRIQGGARWAESTLEIDSLRAWLPRSTAALNVSGAVRLGEPAPVLVLAGDWTALRWPLSDDAVAESSIGRFELQGALPYSFEVIARARVPDLPEADLDIAGSVDRDRLVLERLEGQVLRGRVSGSGRLAWTGDQAWSARATARNLDIGSVRPDLPGTASFTGTVEGRGFTPASPWTVRLASLSGTILGRSLAGSGEVDHRDGTYELRRVRIVNGASHVNVDGRWGPTIDMQWDADIRTLALLHPDLSGQVISSGHARGSPARPAVTAQAQASRLQWGELSAGDLQADLDLDLGDQGLSHAELRATSIDLGMIKLDAATLAASGQAGDHEMSLEFSSPGDAERQMPGFRARLAASGGYDASRKDWRGSLDDAWIEFPDGRAALLQAASLRASADGLQADPVCVETGEARLCLEGEWQADPRAWRVIYSAQDWPLKRLLRSILGWKEFDGRLQASGWATQEPGRPWIGGTTLLLDEPTLDIPRNKFRTERVHLGTGRLDVFAGPEEIRTTLELDMTEGTRAHGEIVAVRGADLAIGQYPLTGLIQAESAALTALPVLVPDIDRSDGHLEISLRLSGTLGDPRFVGEFHLSDGRLDLYRTNLLMSGVTLDGRFAGDELVFDGRGQAARGTIELDGRFTWPGEVLTGRMRLKADQLLVADTPDFRIVASPDLTFTADADGYEVTGNVLIPTARITPKDLSTTVTTSADERVVGLETEQEGPSTLDRVRSRILVELGDNVRVDSYGLKARLAGAVTVVTRPGDVPRGDGSIRVVEGEYKAFGQYVRIVRGVLSYEMTPLDEPTLDLVGEREIPAENIVVAINVRGTLGNPFVTLSSDPPMPDNQALSYLLTGRSINTLQSGEAASLDRAAESLAIGGGSLLLGGLGTRLGLDELSVEQTGDEDTTVVLGKFLSPRLFVSYGISIAEAINTIKLRYTLNERWSVKAEAGLEQGADIEYKIER
jgi:translocation and assembly module TamB